MEVSSFLGDTFFESYDAEDEEDKLKRNPNFKKLKFKKTYNKIII